MRLRVEQLSAALGKGLAVIYVIAGDEPLLIDEAAKLIRAAARKSGAERQSFQVETGFNWAQWTASFDSLSLFANQRLVELRMPSGKPGVEGGKTLENWCARPPSDTHLMVLLPRADKTMQAAKWFTALERAGTLILISPPQDDQLPAWIAGRLARHNLKTDSETLAFLASRVEGNLLAAHQEIEKLSLLVPPGSFDLGTARAAVVDLARYDVSDLPEAFLKGDALRYCRIIDALAAEGETPILALWMLSQELRTLYRLAAGVAAGEPLSVLMREHRVWDSKQALVGHALKRLRPGALAQALRQANRIDRASKGLLREDGWALLKQLGLSLLGKAVLNDEWVYGH